MNAVNEEYLEDLRQRVDQYRLLAEKAIARVDDNRLFWCFHNDANSMAIIMQHISGNMRSRFTNFFTEDGEKPWRHRDSEFEPVLTTREELLESWNHAWSVLTPLLAELRPEDLARTVYIRGEAHSVLAALQRQLAHYAYHIGQLIFLAKMLGTGPWESLSIPKNQSDDYKRRQDNPPA